MRSGLVVTQIKWKNKKDFIEGDGVAPFLHLKNEDLSGNSTKFYKFSGTLVGYYKTRFINRAARS